MMTNKYRIRDHILNRSKSKMSEISTVLIDPITQSHLYIFNVNQEERYCTMMCEPINEEQAYCELSLPFIDSLDTYYGKYSITENDPSIGMNYRKDKVILEKKEESLLAQRKTIKRIVE